MAMLTEEPAASELGFAINHAGALGKNTPNIQGGTQQLS
jgi:hypothetical protein